MPDTAYRPFTVQQARIQPDLGAFRGPVVPPVPPVPALQHRTRTIRGVVLATGPAERGLRGPFLERESDGSLSLEFHGRRRFVGVYR